MPADQFVKVTIPLYYQGHVYRAGLAHPRHDRRAERRPADLVVRRDRARRDRATVSIGYGERDAVAASCCRSCPA